MILSKRLATLDNGAMLGAKPHHGRLRDWLTLIVWLGSLTALTVLMGCETAGSSVSGSHAGVTIKGHGVTDVVLTTREVFADHGFTLARAETDRMIFERPGTKGEQVKYGSFGSTSVVIRAKVDVQEMGPETFYLRCDMFTVRDAGQSVLEDETRMILMRAKPYQSIMDEVATRLNPPEVEGGSEG